MLTRRQIMELIPHQGTMCLLDSVLACSAEGITCAACSHLSPDNPLRRDDRLGAVCGIEYGLQAAALHAELTRDEARCSPFAPLDHAGDPASAMPSASSPFGVAGMHSRSPGYLAALRGVELYVERLDDASFGALRVIARPELRAVGGLIYRFAVESESAALLLRGRATIVFAPSAG